MKSRGFWITASIFIAIILTLGSCSAGFIVARMVPTTAGSPFTLIPALAPSGVNSENRGGTPADLTELFGAFWQSWDLIHEQYVDQPVDDTTLMRGAIRGMLDSLGDQHTSYLDPEEFTILNTSLQGEDAYEGIGAWVDTTEEFLTIISPMPGSPAEKAGLRTGDKIIAIDGEDMTGLDGEVVRKKVLGPAGSTVILTIAREDQTPFDVPVTRASITIPSIEARMLDNDIAYVRIFIFSDNASDELRQALQDLLKENPRGLILDLRNNGGGLLDAAIGVASEFIDDGVIVYEEYGDGTRETFNPRRGGLATDIPMIVLINEGSASASEIVAGAIQDLGRGTLVGTNSFGKGSVQIPTTLRDNQGAVRITVARWLTPNGRTIHEIGLSPDYEVEITDEDFEAGNDPQLDKAIDLLSN